MLASGAWGQWPAEQVGLDLQHAGSKLRGPCLMVLRVGVRPGTGNDDIHLSCAEEVQEVVLGHSSALVQDGLPRLKALECHVVYHLQTS